MSLEGLKESLQKKGYDEARSILENAREEVAAILKNGEKEANAIRAQAEKEAQERASAEYSKEIASAKLTVKKETLTAKKELLQTVFDKTRADLESLRKQKTYTDFLAQLIQAGNTSIGSKAVDIVVNAADTKAAEAIVKDKKIKGTVSAGSISGGAIISTDDGSISIDLSLEKLLSDAYGEHLKDISDRLF